MFVFQGCTYLSQGVNFKEYMNVMNGMRMNQPQGHRVAIQSSIQATCRATYAWTSWTISMAVDCDWKNAKIAWFSYSNWKLQKWKLQKCCDYCFVSLCPNAKNVEQYWRQSLHNGTWWNQSLHNALFQSKTRVLESSSHLSPIPFKIPGFLSYIYIYLLL